MASAPQDHENKKKQKVKTRYDLIPWNALEQITRAMEFGAKKYGEDNWIPTAERSVLNGSWREYAAAAIRHLVKWLWWGEEYAEDSGIHHIAHTGANCLILLHYILEGVGNDDRPFHTGSKKPLITRKLKS